MENLSFIHKSCSMFSGNNDGNKNKVKSLQNLCRATVLSIVTLRRVKNVKSLELPNLLKDYLSSFNIPEDFNLDGFYIDYHCNFPNHVHHKVHQIHPGKCLIDGAKVLIKSQHLFETCRTCDSAGKCTMNSTELRDLWMQLRHENLMTCLMSINDPSVERVCLVFDFPGISLQDFVFRMFLAKQQVPEIITWQVLAKLASVLIYLENNGLIPWELCHPQNVVITNKGEVKLENLLLYLPVKAGSRYQTNTSKRLSPEQLKGCEPTSQTLVWGIGRILYEMCARLPARDPTLKVSNIPPMCYNQAITCTKELSKVMCECLRNNPNSRPSLSSLQARAVQEIEKLQENSYSTSLERNLLTLLQSLDRLPFSGGFLR